MGKGLEGEGEIFLFGAYYEQGGLFFAFGGC